MNKIFLIFLFLCLIYPAAGYCEDVLPVENADTKIVQTEVLPYNFESTYRVPVKLGIIEPISTKDNLTEGQVIKFKVLQDTYCKRRTILKKDQKKKKKIETIITSGMNGFPAEIILGDFEIPNIEKSKLMDSYTKKGQNRCFWVYPLKWSLTIIPFVGSLTNLIMGGHARIKTTDVVTVYYYPDWK